MQTKFISASIVKIALTLVLSSALFSCKKDFSNQGKSQLVTTNSVSSTAPDNSVTPPFNLEVILRSDGNGFGHVKFRQDNDTDRIIVLETWVRDLEPNHSYLLQRAVDPIINGNCLSTAWLTLGEGLQPQAIYTDENGTGKADLWRAVTAVPRGTTFYIHFQVVESTSLTPVLTSDCYQYTVR